MQGDIKKRRQAKVGAGGAGIAGVVGRLGRQRPLVARHIQRHNAKDPPASEASPVATPLFPPSVPSQANIEILTNPSPFAVYALVRQTILDSEAKEGNRIYWSSIAGFQGQQQGCLNRIHGPAV